MADPRWAVRTSGHSRSYRLQPEVRNPLAPLPQEPQQHADARRDEHGLERLLVDVVLQALFPLLGALLALVVVLGRLVADLAAEVAKVLAHLRGRLAQSGLAALALVALVPRVARVAHA